jgi:hypothetical protein
MSKQLERRTIPCEFRVSKDAKPTIFGYAAKFGVRSEDLGGWAEILAPDCFTANLATKPDVRALFNHDPSAILGRTAAGTLTLSEDKVGLAYEVTPPDTQVARDLVVSMQRGDINQSSFGFICTDAAWGYDPLVGMDIRTVKTAELFDVSPVTYPAYTDATSGVRAVEARSLPTDMPAEVRTKLAAGLAAVAAAEKRDDPDADPTCSCDCAQCVAGSCALCSDEDCDDEYCSDDCRASRAAHLASEDRKRSIRIALAQHTK